MANKAANVISIFVIAIILMSAPAIRAQLPDHKLEVGDSFLYDFSLQQQDIVNGTDYGNGSYSPEVLEILNEDKVETVVHSITPLSSTYQVNFTHEKGDMKVLGSSTLDEWQDIYASSFFIILFILIVTPSPGSFDEPFGDYSSPISESPMPLFATSDENSYLDFVQNLNEDKEDIENSTATPPTGAEIINSTVVYDSNVNTAADEFSLNVKIIYNDKSDTPTENWRRSVSFVFDLVIDYNQSIVTQMNYDLRIEMHYEDAEQIFVQSMTAKTSSEGGFIDNIREQITYTQAFLTSLLSFVMLILFRQKSIRKKS